MRGGRSSACANRGLVPRPRAMGVRGTTFFTPPKVSPKITDSEALEQVSALVLGFSAGTLAKATDRSKDSAKHWKAGHACPNLASTINLARSIPAVRAWLMEQIANGEQPEGPQLIAGLEQRIAMLERERGQ
jgi:hypothetical protein